MKNTFVHDKCCTQLIISQPILAKMNFTLKQVIDIKGPEDLGEQIPLFNDTVSAVYHHIAAHIADEIGNITPFRFEVSLEKHLAADVLRSLAESLEKEVAFYSSQSAVRVKTGGSAGQINDTLYIGFPIKYA